MPLVVKPLVRDSCGKATVADQLSRANGTYTVQLVYWADMIPVVQYSTVQYSTCPCGVHAAPVPRPHESEVWVGGRNGGFVAMWCGVVWCDAVWCGDSEQGRQQVFTSVGSGGCGCMCVVSCRVVSSCRVMSWSCLGGFRTRTGLGPARPKEQAELLSFLP